LLEDLVYVTSVVERHNSDVWACSYGHESLWLRQLTRQKETRCQPMYT